jgi:L,D-transpeptidase catalytic domain
VNGQAANPGARLPTHARPWYWAGLGTLALVAACGAVLVPLQGSTPGSNLSSTPGGAPGTAQAAVVRPTPQDLAEPAGDSDADLLRSITLADGPEGRLIAAYVALGAGDGRQALDLVSALVRDHPEFALAQLLYGDLLATRAGVPSAFGLDGKVTATPADERRQALYEEAQRRLSALRERPPAGRLPAEFALLPPSVVHAVAVDTSRARLYLFRNGPDGLKLERDFYVSIGKQGIAKAAEGDKRTPLGVYWITAALPQSQLDQRFGSAALRFNYPNAWDRIQGRTGTGLYLHGVPPTVLTHVPQATDGCVAMSNDDVGRLLKLLKVDTTPVVIAKQLNWVVPEEARQTAAEFRPAYRAWDDARRNADAKDLERWYDRNVPVPAETLQDAAERSDVSFVAWHGDGVPMMVVTARYAGQGAGFRQYWTQREGQWRIVFDGPVSLSEGPAARLSQAVADSGVKAKADKKKRRLAADRSQRRA